MAEVTNELIYSVLQKLEEETTAMRHDVREIKGELTAVRSYLYGIHQDIGNIYAALGRHETRFDRIERRLELREAEPA